MTEKNVHQIRDNETIRREFSDWLIWKNCWPDSAPWDRDWEEARNIADMLRLWLLGYQYNSKTVWQVRNSAALDFDRQFLRTEEQINMAVTKMTELMTGQDLSTEGED